MYECYLDGCPICRFQCEVDADYWCVTYDGDHEPSYEYIGEPEDFE